MIILTKKHLDVEVSNKTVLAGQFRLVVRRADGSIRRDTGWFDNLILDAGLNRWGTGSVAGGAAIGTGTSTPNASQTGLDAQSAFTSTQQSTSAGNSGADPYYGTRSLTYRFALGALNGNYTEVGIGWATGANMFSRALIVDAFDVPTPITVTSDEQLDVSYTLRGYVPTTDVTGTVTIGGVSTSTTLRAANATTAEWGARMSGSKATIGTALQTVAYNGSLGAITAAPSGTTGTSGGTTAAAYSNNSLTITQTATYGLVDANLAGGITAVRFRFSSTTDFQCGFSPAIAKDSTKTLTLSMSHTWARRP